MRNKDTICAIATGVTNAGISIIRISGENAFSIADKLYVSKKPGKTLSSQRSHTMHYGYIVQNGETIDEVLVSIMKKPNSYTAEDVVEINCHGGVIVTRQVLDAVISAGARLAEPGEFTKRAFLNGRIDLSQAEAVIDIINAENTSAVKNSVGQLTGRLKNRIVSLRDRIMHDTAFIEAALDDPEHISLDGFSEELLKNTNEELKEIKSLIQSFSTGRVIKEGIKTVIVGKPNVGKSTLLNALSGTERAIVTDIPGTTRDTLEETVTIDGVTLRIVDTAGIRDTDDTVEKIGVDKALSETGSADLVLFVCDASRALDENDRRIIDIIKDKRSLVLLNKSDLQNVLSPNELEKETGISVFAVSALEETGIHEFTQKIKDMFSLGEIGNGEMTYITNARQRQLLSDAADSLEEVKKSIENEMPEDFFSIDMLDAYGALGRIIGEETDDDLADRIFKDFCMGK